MSRHATQTAHDPADLIARVRVASDRVNLAFSDLNEVLTEAEEAFPMLDEPVLGVAQACVHCHQNYTEKRKHGARSFGLCSQACSDIYEGV